MKKYRKYCGFIAAAALIMIALLCADMLPRERYIPPVMHNAVGFDISSDFTEITSGREKDIVNEMAGVPKSYSLPVDGSPAPVPRQENYSEYTDSDGTLHTTYNDETISVDLWSFAREFEGKTSVINAAKVKIADPSQLRTAFAGGGYSLTARQFTSRMAADNNAVVAINADMYNYTTEGVLIRQGKLYRNIATGWQMLFIDSCGDFHIKTSAQLKDSDFLETHTIYNSFIFGPALVLDGEKQSYRQGQNGVRNNAFTPNPRTAIGQTGELEYVLVMVEGRGKQSGGVRIGALTDIMYDLGCVQAYNLDGGQSSAIVMNNRLMNVPSNGDERSVSEIIYFASALPEE